MKWIIIVVGGVIGIALMVVFIGALLPKAHVAKRSARFRQKPAEVFGTVGSVMTSASWRTDVTKVENLEPNNGRVAWREFSKHGAVSYAADTVWPPMNGRDGRLVTRITDRDLPYSGTWTIDVAPDGDGTRVTVTESGEVYNPLFRFVSRYVMGHTATIDAYLRDLGRHFGQSVEIQDVPPPP
ncbi:MAG: SRPBCC family protein [bacterium]